MTSDPEETWDGAVSVPEPQDPLIALRAKQYIEQLAAMVNQSDTIKTWDLDSIFSVMGDWPSDRNEINRIFFETLNKGPAVLIDVAPMIPPSATQSIKDSLPVMLKHRTDELKQMVSRRRNQIVAYFDAAESELEGLTRARRELDALNGSPPKDPSPQFEAVIRSGLYKFESWSQNDTSITLSNASPFILSETIKKSGVDMRVNLGFFKVKINLRSNRLTVSPLKENVCVNSYYHPHISASNQVCWGNAAQTSVDLMTEGRYEEMLNLLISALTNYNPGNPYIGLYEFVRASGQIQPDGKPVQPPRPVCSICEGDGADSNGDCNCCERCQHDADSCDCCGECNETRDDCDCCGRCSSTAENCDCCQQCDNTLDECECCGICARRPDNCSCAPEEDSSTDTTVTLETAQAAPLYVWNITTTPSDVIESVPANPTTDLPF